MVELFIGQAVVEAAAGAAAAAAAVVAAAAAAAAPLYWYLSCPRGGPVDNFEAF